jgi:hypothetical protein
MIMTGRAVLTALYALWQSKYTVTPIYTITHRNINANVNKIKEIFIALVLPTKSVFKH